MVSGSSSCISSAARTTNSFVPPPPGISPTPNSTNQYMFLQQHKLYQHANSFHNRRQALSHVEQQQPGYRRIPHTHHRILKHAYRHIQFIIFLFNGQHKDHSYIGACTKIRAIICNHKSFIIFLLQYQCFCISLQHFTANTIPFWFTIAEPTTSSPKSYKLHLLFFQTSLFFIIFIMINDSPPEVVYMFLSNVII